MARITEDLLLLLLDNAAGRPALDRPRRSRVLAGAVLLDLAHACLVRPAGPQDRMPGALIALVGPDPGDPVLEPARRLVARRPVTPGAAVARIKGTVEPTVLRRLLDDGQIRRATAGIGRKVSWPLTDRARVDRARAAVLAALFDRQRPSAAAAGVISLLHAVDGLGALLSLNDRGWRWVHDSASAIAAGEWVVEGDAELAEVNLAITASAVRPALT